DLALAVGAGGVEVAQQGDVDDTGPGEVAEQILRRELSPAIDIDWRRRRVLGDRQAGRNAVDRAGRGDDQLADPEVAHRQRQRERAADIDVVILEGQLGGAPDQRESGEV